MNSKGGLLWEDKLPFGFTRILGKSGQILFFTERLHPDDSDKNLSFRQGISRWRRKSEPELILSRPIVTARGRAIYKGKVYEGGGFFYNWGHNTHYTYFLA